MTNPRIKWAVPALGPLAVMFLLGAFVALSGRKPKDVESGSSILDPSPPSRSSVLEIASLSPGDAITGWAASKGNFRLTTIDGRTVLELPPEPMGEGHLVWSRLLPNRGTVRARMWGERTRRSAPRFALGIVATTSFWFRVSPQSGSAQIVGAGEKVIASTPWKWDPEKRVWMEFSLIPPGPEPNARSSLEGRVWHDGEIRPETPTVATHLEQELGFVRAVVAVAPYALKPVYLEHLEILAQ